jgi:hypothetical protein
VFLFISDACAQDANLRDLLRSIENLGDYKGFCAKNPDNERCKPTTGSTLLMRCDSGYSGDVAYCHGSLSAMAMRGATTVPEWKCVPAQVAKQPEQLRLLFIRESRRIPEVLHLPAENLLYYAVITAFPCPAQRAR